MRDRRLQTACAKAIAVASLAWGLVAPLGAAPVTIRDIAITGLSHMDPGTVLNALPVHVGDVWDTDLSQEVIQALFDTGFFEHVQVSWKDQKLVVAVKERPAIGSLQVSGNRDVTTPELKKLLKGIGLAEGYIADPALIKRAQRDIEALYLERGHYAARIQSTTHPLDGGRVALAFHISEGRTAKIQEIRIWGAHAFRPAVIKKDFELTSTGLFTWLTHRDRYTPEKLTGDLERLRAFYFDRGYVKFAIDSVQVKLSPDKEKLYITIQITEGPVYQLGQVELTGDFPISRSELEPYVRLRTGTVFRREPVNAAIEAIQKRLGNAGYAFAQVRPEWDIDEENRLVHLRLEIQPGQQIAVHRIHFTGNLMTQDHVLRRSMVQFEGALASTEKIQESRTQLLRLGFFSDVEVETEPVPEHPDQVDITYTVKEHPSGTITGGVSYSPEEAGIRFELGVSQKNFLGTGNSVDISFNRSEAVTAYGFGFVDPFYTPGGISRGFFLNYTKTNPAKVHLSQYRTDRWGGGVNYGIPMSAQDTLLAGVSYRHMRIHLPQAYQSAADPAGLWVAKEVTDFLGQYGNRYDLYETNIAWQRTTLDKVIFPTQGWNHSAGAAATVPASHLRYYKLHGESRGYYPFAEQWVGLLRGLVAYGNGYGKQQRLPFFEHFLAGGETSVRGFELNSLGPRGTDGEPLGGNVHFEGTAQLFFPNRFLDPAAWRTGVFFDAGNVYHNRFDLSTLRSSVGLVAEWMSPLGSLVFGVAHPVHRFAGDRTQTFFFTIGAAW